MSFLRNRGWIIAFIGLLAAHLAVELVGWNDQSFAGHEFRQSQTALSTYFIQRENNYSIAYPTPVLGKPWSIPMEFPLYEWTVAKLVSWFGWPLVQTGRGVSLACFYLTLPAWYLLLAQCGIIRHRRLGFLALVLTCPIYLSYSRAFMIESMALLFAAWHAGCVIGAVQQRKWVWIGGAWATGIAAACVKVTTWAAVLVPCAVYVSWLLWTRRKRATAQCVWGSLAVLVPLLAALWWVHTSDVIKSQNPAAAFLTSMNLVHFNFGSLSQRFTLEFWKTLWTQWTDNLVPAPAFLALVAGAFFARGIWQLLVGLCLAGFLFTQLLFANLYALHSYYFYANGYLLVGALGFTGCWVLDQVRWPQLLRIGAWSGLLCAGALTFQQKFWARQQIITSGTSGLTEAISTFTNTEDVLVVLGQDWSSVLPFSARRRALMVPAGSEGDERTWKESLARLRDESIGLLVVSGDARQLAALVRRRAAELGMHPQPIFSFHDHTDVYVPEARIHEAVAKLRGSNFSGIDIPRNQLSPGGIQSFDLHRDRAAFSVMSPYPVRYRTPFEIVPWSEYENVPVFLAHTPTELEFSIPSGCLTLDLSYGMMSAAYLEHATDGVEVVVESVESDGSRRQIWRRQLNPAQVASDRGRQASTIILPLGAQTIFVRTLPGPANDPAFDWVYFSAITFR